MVTTKTTVDELMHTCSDCWAILTFGKDDVKYVKRRDPMSGWLVDHYSIICSNCDRATRLDAEKIPKLWRDEARACFQNQ
jgi:uncharacterized protein YbaR (Trm112 family)